MPKSQIGSNTEAFTQLAERLKMQANRPNMYGYIPHEKQIKFHTTPEKGRLYIGGNRAGKTVAGIMECIWWLLGKHPYRITPPPPIRGRILSVDFLNGVSKIILPELARWIPLSELKGGSWATAYSRELRTLTFENGSFVEMMSYDQDLDKFAGTSRHFTHFDEEPPQDIFTECKARLIDTGGSWWMTMSPIEGMTYIYDDVYLPGLEAGNSNVAVIEVDMTENPHLSEGEVQEFIATLSPEDRKARVSGKFVQVGGLVYKNFHPEIHVVDPFVPPVGWEWYASVDHGYNNPTAWLWHAVAPDGQVVTFDEHYQSELLVAEHAAIVHARNAGAGRRPPDQYVGDPSIRNRNPVSGTSIYEEYARLGVPIVLGNNDMVAGLNRVARYLEPQANGIPNLVITRNCHNLINEIGRLRWATTKDKKIARSQNVKETQHKYNDHACFVAGTLISTEQGDRPIESLAVGDLVWTRQGLKPVLETGYTGHRQVWTLISENSKVTATPDHRFWLDQGWKTLDDLRYGDILETWQTPYDGEASITDGTLSPLAGRREVTTSQGQGIESSTDELDSIKTYGERVSEISLQAITYIISMRTRLTTKLLIWSVSVLRNMGYVTESQSSLNSLELYGASGATKSTLRKWLNRGSTSVAVTVSRLSVERPEWITKLGSAVGAGKSINATSTLSPVVALGSVLNKIEEPEKQAVYNLQVAECPEFFANGLLVHNCDSLRYFIMSRPDLRPMAELQEAPVGNVLSAPTATIAGALRYDTRLTQPKPEYTDWTIETQNDEIMGGIF